MSVSALTSLHWGGIGGCGDTASSSSGGSSGTTVNSLTKLPDVTTLVTTGSGTSSLKAAVTGTPPLLKGITAAGADIYFWDGLIAKINAASSVTSDQINSFWTGEGSCRMAQVVGYSFQNVLQGGISLCYMKNAPTSSNGVTINKGLTLSEIAEIFSQGSSSKTILVHAKNFSEGGSGTTSDEDITIKVFGTGSDEGKSGYGADLWFCSAGSVVGYETLRFDSSGTLTANNVHTGFGGTFVGTLAATVKKSGDDFVFDTSKARTATVYFTVTGVDNTFLGKVAIDNGKLTARDYQKGSFGGGPSTTSKHAIYAEYAGETMSTLKMNAAGFALSDTYSGTSQDLIGATEYQTDKYVAATSGTLFDSAKAEKFSDAIYKGETTAYTTLASAKSTYSCTASADIEVTMDFSQSGPKAIQSKCENVFSNMNFCDSTSINAARSRVIQAQINQGSCTTTRCNTKPNPDDFSCQRWADNNIGNSQGITTANARCNSSGCCAKSQ